jgi:hypothetical protein
MLPGSALSGSPNRGSYVSFSSINKNSPYPVDIESGPNRADDIDDICNLLDGIDMLGNISVYGILYGLGFSGHFPKGFHHTAQKPPSFGEGNVYTGGVRPEDLQLRGWGRVFRGRFWQRFPSDLAKMLDVKLQGIELFLKGLYLWLFRCGG